MLFPYTECVIKLIGDALLSFCDKLWKIVGKQIVYWINASATFRNSSARKNFSSARWKSAMVYLFFAFACWVYVFRSFAMLRMTRKDETRCKERQGGCRCPAIHYLMIHNSLASRWQECKDFQGNFMEKRKKSFKLLADSKKVRIFASQKQKGALAHLARALDWQSKGDEFESRMLH